MAPRTHEQWVADQTKPMPAVVTADLSVKMLVLIGANTRLGFEAMKHFAKMNPIRLVLTARDEAKGKDALTHTFLHLSDLQRCLMIFIIIGIQKETGYTKAELWIIDLMNFSSIVAFADQADHELEQLDILIENAGMVTCEYDDEPKLLWQWQHQLGMRLGN